MGKTAVHFGAGNIGRGFVGCFLYEAGYDVIFADVMDNIVNSLNETPSYKVTEQSADSKDVVKTVTNYRAINSKYNEAELIDAISTAEIVTCSVGPNILKFIAPVIAKGIEKRSDDLAPLAVIACENMIGATDALAEQIKSKLPSESLDSHHEKAAYANSAIDRIVPAQPADAGLDVVLEKFYEWVVEELPFTPGQTENTEVKVSSRAQKPNIQAIDWEKNLEPFIERKLFTVNTSHATAAYFGYNRNKPMVHDAMLDKAIKAQVEGAISETAALIVEKHVISEQDQEQYKQKIIKRISNASLGDAVERVGRAPLRKLGRKERFVGPAAQLAEKGMKVDYLVQAMEMAFRFQNVKGDEESEELAKILAENDADSVVAKVCGLSKSDKLYSKVVEVVKTVQADSQE